MLKGGIVVLTGKEALIKLLEGTILVCGFKGDERAYRYNKETNKVEYSDDNKHWKVSGITVNDFLNGDTLRVK